jgi:hypothetical protein
MVAAVAAVVSYQHAHEVALAAGENRLSAVLLPLSIDGAVLAGSMGLLADSRTGRSASRLAWCLLGLGAVATLGANIAAADPHVIARVVAAWPAVAFVLAVETLLSMIRRGSVPAPVTATSNSARANGLADTYDEPTGEIQRDGAGGRGGSRPGGIAAAGRTTGTAAQRSDAQLLIEIRARGLEQVGADKLTGPLGINKTRAVRLRKLLATELVPASGNGHGGDAT